MREQLKTFPNLQTKRFAFEKQSFFLPLK